MKDKLINIFIGILICIMWVNIFIYVNGCSDEIIYYVTEPEPIELLCPPDNYVILFDGNQFTWRELGPNCISPVFYGTKEEAIQSAITRDQGIQDNWDRYLIEYVVVERCVHNN